MLLLTNYKKKPVPLKRQPHTQTCRQRVIIRRGSSNIVLFDRAFKFLMGPMKSPNPGHAVNGFYKKTHCYTPCCGKMPIPDRHINK